MSEAPDEAPDEAPTSNLVDVKAWFQRYLTDLRALGRARREFEALCRKHRLCFTLVPAGRPAVYEPQFGDKASLSVSTLGLVSVERGLPCDLQIAISADDPPPSKPDARPKQPGAAKRPDE